MASSPGGSRVTRRRRPTAYQRPPRPWPGARASSRRCWRSAARMRRVGFHGDLGYSFGGLTRQLDYGGALAIAASPRLTIVGELLGRHLSIGGRLTETTGPHPRLIGDDIRLRAVPEGTERLLAVGGVKWNLAASLLLNPSVLRPLGNAGLNPQWVGAVALEFSLAR